MFAKLRGARAAMSVCAGLSFVVALITTACRQEAERCSVLPASTAQPAQQRPTRVAILNFGPPPEWKSSIGDEVGLQINAESWEEAARLLYADHVDVVVVRINSGGGIPGEIARFHAVFENEYKTRFRTVAWIESAVSAAAMAPYVIEELYFTPDGVLGPTPGWYGGWKPIEPSLEEQIVMMERASMLGHHPPQIMRAMQTQTPLSATVDENTGEVTWFQNSGGETLLNSPSRIFRFVAYVARRFKFARGIAATKEELVLKMGLTSVEWAGENAAKFIDNEMVAVDFANSMWSTNFRRYQLYESMATQTKNTAERLKFVKNASDALYELKRLRTAHPVLENQLGGGAEWFGIQSERLEKLRVRG